MKTERITATAVRKAARRLGPDHPAVIEWRRSARARMAQINNADRCGIASPTLGIAALERAKRAVIDAADRKAVAE